MSLRSWLDENPGKVARLGGRIIEGFREVGLLLMAFTPLDAALSNMALRDVTAFLVGFLGIGALLFGLGLFLEWRYLGVD